MQRRGRRARPKGPLTLEPAGAPSSNSPPYVPNPHRREFPCLLPCGVFRKDSPCGFFLRPFPFGEFLFLLKCCEGSADVRVYGRFFFLSPGPISCSNMSCGCWFIVSSTPEYYCWTPTINPVPLRIGRRQSYREDLTTPTKTRSFVV